MPAGRQPAREESASVRCSFRLIGRSRVYEVSSEALRRRGQKRRERERERWGLRTAKDANSAEPPATIDGNRRESLYFQESWILDNYSINFRAPLGFSLEIIPRAKLTRAR